MLIMITHCYLIKAFFCIRIFYSTFTETKDRNTSSSAENMVVYPKSVQTVLHKSDISQHLDYLAHVYPASLVVIYLKMLVIYK